VEECREAPEATCSQLMLDIQTGQRVRTAPPSRRWRRLGMLLVALGGAAGVLFATGHRAHGPAESRPALGSTVHAPAPQLATQGRQEQATRLPDPPAGAARPAVIPPASGAQAGRDIIGGAGLRHSPPPSAGVAGATAPDAQADREVPRPEPDAHLQATRSRPIPRAPQSLLSEFDPNAELVLSRD
jgi:hypothetical protein